MTAGAAGRGAERAPAAAYHRRERTLMRLSTAMICLAAVLLTLNVGVSGDVTSIYVQTAQVFGAVLLLALALECGGRIRSLLRADVVMLVALYGLVFIEFLFPQPGIAGQVSVGGAQAGTIAALAGFAAIAVGRHFPLRAGALLARPAERDLSSRRLVQLFLIVAFFGYLHILLAVKFDIVEAVRAMALPRFHQPWGRGRLGGVHTLLHEVGLMIFLIPPLAGVIFAEVRRHGTAALAVVAAVLALTLYMGFAGGTRSTFIVYVMTFTVAYLLARPLTTLRELVMVGVPAAAAVVAGTVYMLEFRKVGLANYDLGEIERKTLFIDLNLVNISQLTEVFPARYAFLGWEIPYAILIRPVPRALWPGKPEGLSVGIEQALGAEGLTLSVSFVGEAFMAWGMPGVMLAGLVLGALAATWNAVGRRLDSNFKLVFYASGFFAAALAMRSILQVAPAMLPTLFLWVYGRHRGYLR